MSAYFAEIHNHFMLLQRRMRKARLRRESPVHYQHGLILNHLSSDSELVARDIAREFGLQMSKVSRILSDLEQEGYISKQKSGMDRRRNDLRFTDKGIELLDELREISSQLVKDGFAGLDHDDQQAIVSGLKAAADGMQVTTLPAYPAEHPLVPQQQRLIRGQAVLSSNYMGSDYSLHEYHILLELMRSGDTKRGFDELAEIIPLSRSKLSRTLGSLVKDGLVLREVNVHDKRKIFISLAAKGKEEYQRLQVTFGEMFKSALDAYSENQLALLKQAFSRLEALPLLSSEVLDQMQLIKIESDRDRTHVRAYLVAAVVKKGCEHLLPEVLIASDSTTYVLESSRDIKGVIEVVEGKQESCVNILWIDPDENILVREYAVPLLLKAATGEETADGMNVSSLASFVLQECRLSIPRILRQGGAQIDQHV